ncbi:MAG TPA: hypothetical protein VGM88_28905 [Kofleriaceae bacterium]|jgi:hypothetical protein
MRRAAAWLAVGALGAAGATSRAHAAPWQVTAEAGVEDDSNVQRVDTGPGLDTAPIQSFVERAGVRLDGRGKLLGGGYALTLGALARVADSSDAKPESVTLFNVDGRWLHPIGDGAVSIGAGATFADALPLDDDIGDRTFRYGGGDAIVSLKGGDDKRLTLAVGGRDFVYKPDHSFDWVGPVANARLDITLWGSPERTKGLDLGIQLGAESRDYHAHALANGCAPNAPPDPTCSVGTSIPRHDRFKRAGVELLYTGRVIATLGYQMTVVDSNSYSFSIRRHRALAQVTTALPWHFYATALGILDIDTYTDGYLLSADTQHLTYASLDDEDRSSLQLRLARPLTKTWSIEGRAAIWRDLGTTMATSFHRELGYLGVIYSR